MEKIDSFCRNEILVSEMKFDSEQGKKGKKMRKNLVISTLLLLAFWLRATTLDSSTKQAILIDNDRIHSYGERLGKWVILAESPVSLNNLLKEYETSEEELKEVNSLKQNEIVPVRKPIFIPYSESYIQNLSNKGQGRDIVLSDYRDFVWPVGTVNAKISSKLGLRRHSMHTGIDIACPHRSPILAAGDGVVTSAAYNGNYGLAVFIQHDINQIQTLYAHNSYLLVKEGERVQKGQIIAFSGSTGHSTGPHLHFEVRYQNIVLNPEHYIQVQPIMEPKVAIGKDSAP
jgi:murein DD-endopeptidase MepM/ murein hydrolase activator NlpD